MNENRLLPTAPTTYSPATSFWNMTWPTAFTPFYFHPLFQNRLRRARHFALPTRSARISAMDSRRQRPARLSLQIHKLIWESRRQRGDNSGSPSFAKGVDDSSDLSSRFRFVIPGTRGISGSPRKWRSLTPLGMTSIYGLQYAFLRPLRRNPILRPQMRHHQPYILETDIRRHRIFNISSVARLRASGKPPRSAAARPEKSISHPA